MQTVNEWSLREEVLGQTQRWPVIVLFVLAGAIVGWIAGMVWPSPYQASAGIYVGLNTYRGLDDRNTEAQAHTSFNWPDDYKNWQMANLDALVFSDNVLEATLDRLRQQDEYWEGVSRDDLRGMLDAYWRNAGKWRLVAIHRDSRRAVQAVEAWEDVSVSRTQAAVAQAQNTLMIDFQLQEVAARESHLLAYITGLEQLEAGLLDFQAQVEAQPDQPLSQATHDQLWTWATLVGESNSARAVLLEALPEAGAPAGDYRDWLSQALNMTREDIRLARERQSMFEQERLDLESRYSAAAKGSLGFSATLEVEKLSAEGPEVEVLRPTSLLMLVGACLGLLAWALTLLARIGLGRKA